MQTQSTRRRSVSGHIYRKTRSKGDVWYWKVRLPTGGEERKAIGPVWTGTGRTPDGYFTERTAKAALEARLTDLRRGIGIPFRNGATFRDAAEHWHTTRGEQRAWKPSTKRDYAVGAGPAPPPRLRRPPASHGHDREDRGVADAA